MRRFPRRDLASSHKIDGRPVQLPPAFGSYWYRQPSRTARSFDPVAIPPSVLIEGHVVVKDKDVGFVDLVEVTSPWNVGRLKDHALHRLPWVERIIGAAARSVVERTV